jgi:hypothetical protein
MRKFTFRITRDYGAVEATLIEATSEIAAGRLIADDPIWLHSELIADVGSSRYLPSAPGEIVFRTIAAFAQAEAKPTLEFIDPPTGINASPGISAYAGERGVAPNGIEDVPQAVTVVIAPNEVAEVRERAHRSLEVRLRGGGYVHEAEVAYQLLKLARTRAREMTRWSGWIYGPVEYNADGALVVQMLRTLGRAL